MRRLLALTLLLSLSVVAQQNSASAPQNPPFQLDSFYLAIMHRANPYDGGKAQKLAAKQQAYWQSIAVKGDLMLGGPVLLVKDNLAAMFIYRAANADAAAQIANNDPVVASHLWTVEVHPWVTQKDVLKPLKTYSPDATFYLGLLLNGPKYTSEDSPERRKILAGHMANVKRLGEMGKLLVAGPFNDDSKLAGIFVFRTATMQEGEELAHTDPTVQPGFFAIQFYEWKLPGEGFASGGR